MYKNDVNVVENKYLTDENGNEYWIIRISSSLTNKANSIQHIYDEGNYDTLIVCASGKSDLELVEKADLSISLSTVNEQVKNKCDLVINGNAENILKVIDKIYHSNNVNKTIANLKKKEK